jgi:hypothetical protein
MPANNSRHSGARHERVFDARWREPGIHNPGAADYGFRVRALNARPGMTG